MFRLDYISCVLTISATILLGKKRWQGWLIAGINSVVVCDIALNTSQLGLIPANVFCVALCTYNIVGWRKQIKAHRELDRLSPSIVCPATPAHVASSAGRRRTSIGGLYVASARYLHFLIVLAQVILR
jgi:hypothetical protein